MKPVGGKVLGRKQARKAERQLKKARNNAFAQRKPIDEIVPKTVPVKVSKKKKSASKKVKFAVDAPETSQKSEKIQKDEKEMLREKRKAQRRALSQDDGEIKYYARMLGYKKLRHNVMPNIFITEGLDYLLDACDSDKRKELVESEEAIAGDAAESSGDEFAYGRESSDDEEPDELPSTKRGSAAAERQLQGRIAEETSSDGAKSKTKPSLTDTPLAPNNDEDVDEQADSGDDSDTDASEVTDAATHEDIYGRTVDGRGRLIERDAHAARHKLAELEKNVSTDDRLKLGRLIRGLVNRLSEATLQSSAKQIASIFQQEGYSRNDVKQVLSDTIVAAISTPFAVPDRLAIEITVFLALVHSHGLTEITSHFVETLVTKFQISRLASESQGKSLANYASLLSQLLNFKGRETASSVSMDEPLASMLSVLSGETVVKATLLMDILKMLLASFSEMDVELIITIFTYCGMILRKQEGQALKTFVVDIQSKIEDNEVIKEFENRSRVQFLFDTIMAIKNGNAAKISHHFDITLLEHYRKVLLGLRKGAKEAPLPMGLDDLLNADTNGRWWVVGSAWTSAGTDHPSLASSTPLSTAVSADVARFPSALLKLAKKARMNTDLRRLIFCTIMSSEDFLDCFEKLNRLNLKDQREREIIHILVQCCVQEKQFNRYYGLVLQKFCSLHQRFQLTMQFALWDRIKQLPTMQTTARDNLSDLTIQLLQCEAIGVSTLKIIDFAQLDHTTSKFLQRTLLGVFERCSSEQVGRLFKKTVANAGLRAFADGLQVFLHRVMRKKHAERVGRVIDALDVIWNND